MRTCLQCGQQTDGLHCPQDGMATVLEGVTPASAVLTDGQVFAGRYRILGVLGRGGMGAVYDAQHTGTGQPVAIKTLLLDNAADRGAVRRFFHEAKMTAALQHPNTVRVFDFGQSDDGILYLAMERLRGETLADLLMRKDAEVQRMSAEEAGRIAMDVLRSLAEAHHAGLVHRDLKPANIFLHDLGGGERIVKVLDFGIAKSNDTHLTKTGTSIGTPSYMSPEQVMSGQVDGRSDLYALGVILYGCVVGSLPFQADSSYSMMMKHVAEPAPDLNGLQVPGITAEFAAVVQRALAKKPEDRFADAQAMREALEHAIRPRPVAARTLIPPTAPTQALLTPDSPTVMPQTPGHRAGEVRAPQPSGRPPMAVLVLGGVAVAVLTAGLGIWWSTARGHQAEAANTSPAAESRAAAAAPDGAAGGASPAQTEISRTQAGSMPVPGGHDTRAGQNAPGTGQNGLGTRPPHPGEPQNDPDTGQNTPGTGAPHPGEPPNDPGTGQNTLGTGAPRPLVNQNTAKTGKREPHVAPHPPTPPSHPQTDRAPGGHDRTPGTSDRTPGASDRAPNR